jgi:Sigma-70 region 2
VHNLPLAAGDDAFTLPVRRKSRPAEDYEDMTAGAAPRGSDLLALYDDALGHVYGYLLSRCGRPATAEDLTSETFLAAADAVRAGSPRIPATHR